MDFRRGGGPVIVIDPPSQIGTCLAAGLEGVYVDALILQRPPQPLDENVVHPATAAIHRNLDASLHQQLGKPQTGELAALISIEYLRPAMQCQGFFQCFSTEFCIHGIRWPPRQHLPAGPVHHRNQIQKAPPHRNAGDVGAPDLVRLVDHLVAQQTGPDLVLRMRNRRLRSPVDRLQPHLPHQPLHLLATDLVAQSPQVPCHLAAALPRRPQELLIDEPHRCQVQRLLIAHLSIVRRPAYRNQFALPYDR